MCRSPIEARVQPDAVAEYRAENASNASLENASNASVTASAGDDLAGHLELVGEEEGDEGAI